MSKQVELVLGANTVIENTKCAIAFSTTKPLGFGQQLGLLWLPLDAYRKAVCSPAYLHESKDWAQLDNKDNPSTWQLDLPQLFDTLGVSFLQLIAYVYHEPSLNLPAVELNDVSLTLNNGDIRYNFTTNERHVKAAIILEIYQRNGQFKCRALGEASTQGLASLEHHVQVSLNVRPPSTHTLIQEAQQQQRIQLNNEARPPRHVQAGETWTGTAFAIDPYHLLSCYHVIESAAMVGIRQQGQPDREAQVVLSDIGSDSAIIRVSDPLPSHLPLAQQCVDILGETITTLGFPLSGLSSQLQVTQGCISGLTGLNNDIRHTQFTAPIQPGSSGSPLLLPTGEVVGMVTSSLVHEHAQNMNYAVKFQLLSALLASAGISLENTTDLTSATPLTTPQLSKQSRSALWLVGCQG
ncbi:trypsin-like peptidase domain-containing protein [Psychrobacter sp. Ps2]|uniref:trypsin-like peptidase domain-containing protein n=1 Tax=Psychrobacter sp. Ps2 TaxID=2790956 RepID=UPI001EE088F3|nr:trypsin-like peptidase domain-containing protein [Psychrobacter sp. Ps2]MCG3858808.1 trypsin-like peptidase domain-containing protein [Psychrobacter sp. Ps2]